MTQTLPDDVRAALFESAKSFMREHYVGGLYKLRAWQADFEWYVNVYSFTLPGSTPKNLRRLVKLVSAGLLVERPRRSNDTGARRFTAPRPVLDEIGLEAQRYWESVGYRVGEMMEEIKQ